MTQHKQKFYNCILLKPAHYTYTNAYRVLDREWWITLLIGKHFAPMTETNEWHVSANLQSSAFQQQESDFLCKKDCGSCSNTHNSAQIGLKYKTQLNYLFSETASESTESTNTIYLGDQSSSCAPSLTAVRMCVWLIIHCHSQNHQ